MGTPEGAYATSWLLADSTTIEASPLLVFALVSDITRTGEWSPECEGGSWVSGAPGAVGSRFHGHNANNGQSWTTECEVIEARTPRTFAFRVFEDPPVPGKRLEAAPGAPTISWRFAVEPGPDGTCVLTQSHTMSAVPVLLRTLLAGETEERRHALLRERRGQLHSGITATLARIKAVAEALATGEVAARRAS